MKLVVISLASMALLACGGGGGSSAAPQQLPDDKNNAPQISGQPSARAYVDLPYEFKPSAFDPDGNKITFTLKNAPAWLSVNTASGALEGVPSAADVGQASSISLTVSDGELSGELPLFDLDISVAAEPVISIASVAPQYARSAVSTATSVVANPPLVSQQWTQLKGTAVSGLGVDKLNLGFEAPDVSSVEILSFKLVVLNEAGQSAEQEVDVEIRPLSSSGNSRTLKGRADGKGVDLVVVGDGFTAADKDKFFAEVEKLNSTMFNKDAISKHAEAWNLHALWAESVEAGADIPTEGIDVNTRFNARFDCNGIRRLLCVNTGDVIDYVAAAGNVPFYDQVLVVVNSTVYGGAGYSTLGTYSLSSSAINVAIHEMGHSFAGLADEYDYGKTDVLTFEPNSPNATIETDASKLKWKHWIDDLANVPTSTSSLGWAASKVGHFEGAVYRTTGVYRPTYNSIMRSSSQPFYAVNAEAWALSVYRKSGSATKFYSPGDLALNASQLPVGDVDFSVELLAPGSQSVSWYVNNVLQAAAVESSFSYGAGQTTSYQVKASIRDTSGLIRQDTDSVSSKDIIWTVQF